MAELKTQATGKSVAAFLKGIKDERTREDCMKIAKLMQEITRDEPEMWGPSIVGFGRYHYKGKSGREGDWFLTGFSPRKQNLTLYCMGGFEEHADLMEKLGKHKTAKSCLYIKSVDDVHLPTLKKLIQKSVAYVKKSSAA